MGQIYPLFAPAVGAIGAFLAGSNTVSNLMLSQFQYETASLLSLSGAFMVASQSVGAAAGNMVAIHNVVAASATVGLLGREGDTLRITIIPTLYYIVFAGLISLFSLNFLNIKDPLVDSKKYDFQIFSGPMGVGLNKSYLQNNEKICVYNTINGEKIIRLKNTELNCKKNYE